MALAVVGNVQVEQVLAVCDECLKPSTPVGIERSFADEPREIVKPYNEYHFAMSMPVFAFGYKEACEKPLPTYREYIETNILLEIIAGKTSPLYQTLFAQGLINASFDSEYFIGNGYEAVIFDGESEQPQAVADALKQEVARLKKEGIDEALFESVRRSQYGREIMSYNDIDSIANSLIACDFNGWKLFDAIEIYKTITVFDIEKRLAGMLEESYSALSVVKQ